MENVLVSGFPPQTCCDTAHLQSSLPTPLTYKCIRVCKHIHVYTHAHTRARARARKRVHTHSRTHAHARARTHTQTHLNINVRKPELQYMCSYKIKIIFNMLVRKLNIFTFQTGLQLPQVLRPTSRRNTLYRSYSVSYIFSTWSLHLAFGLPSSLFNIFNIDVTKGIPKEYYCH
jgi:hypothetical protein